MDRPTSIKIGPSEWTIKYKKSLGEVVGLTKPHKHEILIEIHPEQSMRATLIHEILHAICWTYGFYPDMDELEEAVVSVLAVPLLLLIQDNPDLVAYLDA